MRISYLVCWLLMTQCNIIAERIPPAYAYYLISTSYTYTSSTNVLTGKLPV